MKSLLICAVTCLAGGLMTASANASVIFSDNFDMDTAVENWSGDAVFTAVPAMPVYGSTASVDLVGAADGFQSLAYNGGVSVDLDGTTGSGQNPAGEIQSTTTLNGDYTVSFLLAGNMRGYTPETTTVKIGAVSYAFTPPSTQGYTLETLYFKNVSGLLTFTELGA